MFRFIRLVSAALVINLCELQTVIVWSNVVFYTMHIIRKESRQALSAIRAAVPVSLGRATTVGAGTRR